MADVVFVCVREDMPYAEILAEIFEEAGCSIGDAWMSDEELSRSGAAIVLWSGASIRCRPFIASLHRMTEAKKAVVGCLIKPPPPCYIDSAPAFDLSAWEGFPDDHALDGLFFAVDRLVSEAHDALAPASLFGQPHLQRFSADWTTPLPTSPFGDVSIPAAAEAPRAA